MGPMDIHPIFQSGILTDQGGSGSRGSTPGKQSKAKQTKKKNTVIKSSPLVYESK